MSKLYYSRTVWSLLRKAAQQARESLQDLVDSLPRSLNPKPSLVRVPVSTRRSRPVIQNGFGSRNYFTKARSLHSKLGKRFFSSRTLCTGAQLVKYVQPETYMVKNVLRRNFNSAVWDSTLRKKSTVLDRLGEEGMRAFGRENERFLINKWGARSIHSWHNTHVRPSKAFKNIWESRSRNFRAPIRARMASTQPHLMYPEPSFASVINSEFNQFGQSDSIQSFTDLITQFKSFIPKTGSYVEFDTSPTLTIPPVSQLSDEVVDTLAEDIDRFAEELKRIARDIRRLATLGELPISIEEKSIRVYFANSEPSRVESLLSGVEVTNGVVRNQSNSAVLSTCDELSDSSSMYAESSAASEEQQYFYSLTNEPVYSSMSDSAVFSDPSLVSVATPDLTNSPSDTVSSDESSYLYA